MLETERWNTSFRDRISQLYEAMINDNVRRKCWNVY